MEVLNGHVVTEVPSNYPLQDLRDEGEVRDGAIVLRTYGPDPLCISEILLFEVVTQN
jgi:hypothetical protein